MIPETVAHAKTKDHKYKRVTGIIEKTDAYSDTTTIPYAVEAFLVENEDPYANADVTTMLNNTATYGDVPFQLKSSNPVKFGKRHHYVNSFGELLRESKFTRAKGVDLVINVITPTPEFTDRAKTHINADDFKDGLANAVYSVTKDAIKEVERADRESTRQDRSRSISGYSYQRTTKEQIMYYLFDEAYKTAKGSYSVVTARQIFYVLRALANQRYHENLLNSDYNTFTQKVCTYFENKDGYKIILERRGFFVNPFDNEEIPLGTLDVLNYISKQVTHEIYEKSFKVYSIPFELQFNKVLFIEKQGYTGLFRASKLMRELNMGVISTSGFGTRAVKTLMQHFHNHGIQIYVMHDCDISGYLIADKFRYGSNTYRRPIPFTDIGLTVEDIKALGKDTVAEVSLSKKSYSKSLRTFPESAREFFVVQENDPDYLDGSGSWNNYQYRRVEINALSNDELLEYIRSKVDVTPVIPDEETLHHYIEGRHSPEMITYLLKEALYQVNRDKISEDGDLKKSLVEIDYEKITDTIMSKLLDASRDKKYYHWTDALDDVYESVKNDIIKNLVGHLGMSNVTA